MNLGDGISGLLALAAAGGGVDVSIFDPPYSAYVHAHGRSGISMRNYKDPSRVVISRRKPLGFAPITPEQIDRTAQAIALTTRRWALVFSDIESCHLWRAALERAGMDYVRAMIWSKFGGAPQFSGDRPAVAAEAITLVHPPGRKQWNGGGRRGIYPARGSYVPADEDTCYPMYERSIVLPQRGERRMHTAQKPIALMRDLIRDFTRPGELVADAFAGVGTTGAAALGLGRRFVGWEISKRYHAAASSRLRGLAE